MTIALPDDHFSICVAGARRACSRYTSARMLAEREGWDEVLAVARLGLVELVARDDLSTWHPGEMVIHVAFCVSNEGERRYGRAHGSVARWQGTTGAISLGALLDAGWDSRDAEPGPEQVALDRVELAEVSKMVKALPPVQRAAIARGLGTAPVSEHQAHLDTGARNLARKNLRRALDRPRGQVVNSRDLTGW